MKTTIHLIVLFSLSFFFIACRRGGTGLNSTDTGAGTSPVALHVAAGIWHTCAVLSSGRVKCWGGNDFGQLGNGTTTGTVTCGKNSFNSQCTPSPVEVTELTGVIAITAEYAHTCALLSSGSVKCWGDNGFGQLGNGNTADSSTPVEVTGLTDVTAIAAGAYHTCAVLSSGSVKCWGYNDAGQLGNGTKTNSLSPVEVTGLNSVRSLSSGYRHTCAVLATGSVKCWGANSSGQLGNGSTADSSTPVDVTGLTGVTDIAAEYAHTCALLTSGSVKCWGDNDYGQLGNGSTADSSTPVDVTGLTGVTDIAAGGAAAHTCVVLSLGKIKCWGYNVVGQLGNSSSTGPDTCVVSGMNLPCSTTPVEVTGLTGVTDIESSTGHTCTVLSSGGVKCWSWNSAGQLGNGSTAGPETCVFGDLEYSCSTTPVDVVGL